MFVIAANVEHRERNGDESRLQGAEERSHVVKTLRRQYQRPAARRPALLQFPRHVRRAADRPATT